MLALNKKIIKIVARNCSYFWDYEEFKLKIFSYLCLTTVIKISLMYVDIFWLFKTWYSCKCFSLNFKLDDKVAIDFFIPDYLIVIQLDKVTCVQNTIFGAYVEILLHEIKSWLDTI